MMFSYSIGVKQCIVPLFLCAGPAANWCGHTTFAAASACGQLVWPHYLCGCKGS